MAMMKRIKEDFMEVNGTSRFQGQVEKRVEMDFGWKEWHYAEGKLLRRLGCVLAI
jgi:hypothetical protein